MKKATRKSTSSPSGNFLLYLVYQHIIFIEFLEDLFPQVADDGVKEGKLISIERRKKVLLNSAEPTKISL